MRQSGTRKMLMSAALVSLVVSCAVLVSGCATGGSSAPSNTEVTTYMDASWTRLYHDLGSLKRASDVVVEGSVTAVIGQTMDQSIPFTDFSFQIAHAHFDPGHLLKGSTIVIHQTGGTVVTKVNGTTTTVHMQIADDPMMQVGDHLFLFLHQYAPGHYFVVGGPSGRFVVRNGIVQPINSDGVLVSGSPDSVHFASAVQSA